MNEKPTTKEEPPRKTFTGWRVKDVKPLFPDHWTGVPDYHQPHHVIFSRSGPMAGPGYVSSRVAKVTLDHHYSGSGPDSFGGVKAWPHLKVEMSFPAGTEAQLPELAAKLAKVVDEYMGLNMYE